LKNKSGKLFAVKLIGAAALSAVIVCVPAGCSSSGSQRPESKQSVSEIPANADTEEGYIVETSVSEVSEYALETESDSPAGTPADIPLDSQKSEQYQNIINGYGDKDVRYYLVDITGDEQAELIVGEDILTVYRYFNDAVVTLGTVAGEKVYYSDDYGIMTVYVSDNGYELRAYKFDGELLSESVLAMAEDEAGFESAAGSYLDTGRELEEYKKDGNSPF